jgi:mRNA interferase MazF
MVIEQGDVAWVILPPARGSAPAGRRPAVVLQHDRFNRTRIATTVVAAITSNLRLAALPGNVRLARGEAGLPRPSVVNVTQIATVDRADLVGRIGHLSRARLSEVWRGVVLVLAPDEPDVEVG